MNIVWDTSLFISPPDIGIEDGRIGITSITYSELQFGALVAKDEEERAKRTLRLNRIRGAYGVGIPFDDAAADSYGLLSSSVHRFGRNPRRRAQDIMIAAIAHSREAAIWTRNAEDLRGIEHLVRVIGLETG